MQQTTGGRYTGLTLAYLPRNSTRRQDGNYSQQRQGYVIAEHIVAQGGTPVAYDEGIASGRDLGKRPAALRALDDIDAGKLHGLAWEKIDRVTRDEHGTDAGIIAERLGRRRALLVTLDRDYRLWQKDDLRLFRILTGIAGVETLDIRDRLWSGVLEKAKEEPFFMGNPPFAYTTRLEETRARGAAKRSKIERKPERDDRAAPVMSALATALDECTALGEVAARLNSQGHFRWATAGELAGAPTTWQVGDVRRILEHPIYEGWWTLGRGSDGTSSIWEGGPRGGQTRGGKIAALAVPHLAWFAGEQLEGWRVKYPRKADKSGPRRRGGEHPLRGVLACVSCGRAMIAMGPALYGCPLASGHYAEAPCPAPQRITQRGAVRALLGELPRALAAVATREAELMAAAAEDDELDALRRRRDMRARQSEVLVEQVYPDDWDGTPNEAAMARLRAWQAEIDELDARIARREQLLSTDPATRARVEAVLRDPAAIAGSLPENELLPLLRLIFAGVRIRTGGWASGRTYTVEGYENLLLDSAVDGGAACTTTVYSTILSYLERTA